MHHVFIYKYFTCSSQRKTRKKWTQIFHFILEKYSIYIHIYIHIYTYTYIHVCIFTYKHVHVYAYSLYMIIIWLLKDNHYMIMQMTIWSLFCAVSIFLPVDCQACFSNILDQVHKSWGWNDSSRGDLGVADFLFCFPRQHGLYKYTQRAKKPRETRRTS